MNLLIVEWISGGGYSGLTISSSILSEGYAMLRSLIGDFKSAGHNVTTFLDSRLTTFNPPNKADKIISVSSRDEFYNKITELTTLVDGVYVIAPESGQILQNIVNTVEKTGGTSLNCSSDALKRVSNKMTTCKMLKKNGLKVPETILVNGGEPDSIKVVIKKLGYPVVFKPLDGVGCAGLSLVKTEKNVLEALVKVSREATNGQFVVQKWVEGESASVCLFSDGKNALPVTLNQQFVNLATPEEDSAYCGGIIPFNHPLRNEALATAKRAVEIIGELKGYVGVDMVLSNKELVVMEVNPRLTMSYVGLTKVVNFNPAQAILNAAVNGELPKNVQIKGWTFFSKIELPSRVQNITETDNMKEIISPPFPVEEKKPACALFVTESTSFEGAQSTFYRVKRQLLNSCKGD